MSKRRIVLLACLALVLAVCCVLAVACGGGGDYTVTWVLGKNVESIAIEGYEYESEMEFDDGTEISFTVKCATGYEVEEVRAGSKKITPKNGVYKYIVKDNVTITVTAKVALNKIEVELVNQDAVWYAGETVKLEDLKVTAYWAIGDPTVETSNSYVLYQNGNTLSLGDTSFTVTFGGKSKTIEIEAVKGLIKLDLRGGQLSAEDLAALPSNKQVNGDIVTWTFSSAFESDFVLPESTRIINSVECPFVRWSNVEEKTDVVDGKIPAGTNVSVTAIAIYNIPLVKLSNLSFADKEGVPYLVVEGTLVAVDSATLVFVEGNQHIQYEKRFEAKKVGANTTFKIEVNLAELAQSKPVYFGENEEEEGKDLPTSFKGPWLDIRFVSQNGSELLQQELILEQDDDYASAYDAVAAKVGEEWLRFSFKTWGPQAGDAITGGNGATFTGTELILKLYYEDCPDVVVDYADLEEKEDVAYLVLHGKYVDKTGVVNKQLVEAQLQQLVASTLSDDECSIQNFHGWGRPETTRAYTVADDLSWTISFSLENTEHGGEYYVHLMKNNVIARTQGSVKIGSIQYTLVNDKGTGSWTAGLVWLKVVDESAKTVTYKGATLEQDVDKIYLVLDAEFAGYTEADLKTITYFEKEMTLTVEKVVITGNTVKLYFNFTDVEANGEWWWGHWTINGENKGDIKCPVTANEIVYEGKRYKLATQWDMPYVVVSNA